jgi:23S rRNA (pseudouridine1915-N3)-methyltransferase
VKPTIQFISVKSKKSNEFENLFAMYESKIRIFCDLKFDEIKSFEADRSQKAVKVLKESEAIEAKINSGSFIILCDERGRNLNSLEFAEQVAEQLGVRKKITFIIGGAFGVSRALYEKVDLKVSLSPFVLNHLMAKAVLLEQIYRTFTIINKRPYHNE